LTGGITTGYGKLRGRGKNSLPFAVILIILAVLFAGRELLALRGAGRAPADGSGGMAGSVALLSPESIPDYAGEPVIDLSGGIPGFTEEDLRTITGEIYSEPDLLGRCGPAAALLTRGMMPSERRSSTPGIRPTGWVQEKYPGIVDADPPYLYNRCHLIAYALTGREGDERSLITGTRYMNIEGMLPYEVMTARYLERSDGKVLYRVTPYFKGNERLARGVEMEAWSVEDRGEGLCFHVFVYNVQPGIHIDYLTGNSRAE